MPIDAGIDERKYLNQALEKCIKYLRIKELWFEEVLYKAKMLEIEINEIPTKSTTYSAWRAVCIEFILISTF